MVFLLNRTACATLNWRTPIEIAFGETPDLSVLLQYSFYEQVLYLDSDTKYPDLKEKPGRFVGIAENCGDALTYLILIEDTNQVISRSIVRPADDKTHPNLRATPALGEGGPKIEMKESFLHSMNELTQASGITIQPEDLIGVNLVAEDTNGNSKAEVVEENSDGTFKIKFINGNEKNMTYADLVDAVNKKDEEGYELWTFSDIINHRTTKGKIEIEIKWDTGEVTWEPMAEIRKTDPVTIARYAKDNELSDKPGWKWTRRYTKNEKKFIRLSKQMKATKKNTKKISLAYKALEL